MQRSTMPTRCGRFRFWTNATAPQRCRYARGRALYLGYVTKQPARGFAVLLSVPVAD
jgi:hypothetical protein